MSNHKNVWNILFELYMNEYWWLFQKSTVKWKNICSFEFGIDHIAQHVCWGFLHILFFIIKYLFYSENNMNVRTTHFIRKEFIDGSILNILLPWTKTAASSRLSVEGLYGALYYSTPVNQNWILINTELQRLQVHRQREMTKIFTRNENYLRKIILIWLIRKNCCEILCVFI